MAIAPLLDIELGAPSLDSPWPRTDLRLIEPAPDGWSAAEDDEATGSGPVALLTAWRPDVVVRRRPSARVRRRRRLLVSVVAVAGVTAALAVPVAALGGRPATVPRSAGAQGLAATVYVVQPGDTLWSIASRFAAGGDPRPLAEALARETGSATVVPGERIAIP